MRALCRQRGFEAERADALTYLESLPDASLGGPPPALLDAIAALNANAEKLNARLFGFMDYAVVGRR